MEKVALVGPIDKAGKGVLKQMLSEQFEIVEVESEAQYPLLEDASYIVLRTLPLKREHLNRLSKLKLIQRWGSGYDMVDIVAAGEQGIQVAVAAGTNSVSVAEYAILMMLSVLRNITVAHSNVVSGRWRDKALTERSFTLQGKTVGIAGMGEIGRLVAARVKAFGANILYYDVIRQSEQVERDLELTFVGLEELAERSDVVSLHLPLTDQTQGMINDDFFDRMKPNGILVNTARGKIVDQEALVRALKENKILGAGLDVFWEEPVSVDNPLLAFSNVVLSSHNAGNTADNSIKMAEHCAKNILGAHNGEPLPRRDLVNGAYLKASL